MGEFPTAFRLAQTVGFTGAAWLSGNISALSMNTIPALLSSAHHDSTPLSTTVQQWRRIYDHGKAQNPPIAAITASAFAYLAWCARPGSGSAIEPLLRPHSVWYYGVAAALTLGIVPWTVGAMAGTNGVLVERAEKKREKREKMGEGEEEEEEEKREVEALLGRWNALNAVRAVLPLLGGVVGLWASFY